MSNAGRDDAVVVMQFKEDVKTALDEDDVQNLELENKLKRILFKYQKPIVNLKQRILLTIVVIKSLEGNVSFFEDNAETFENVFYNWEVPKLPVSGHDIKDEISYAAKNPKSLSMFVRMCEKAYIESDLSL